MSYLRHIAPWVVLSALSLTHCTEDPPLDPCGVQGELCLYTEGVFVVNEGQFTVGNASISHLDENTGTLTGEIFQKANGRILGDIAQSVTVIGNKAYIVVNNSQKIEVVDANTFQESATISGFVSPRYLIDAGNGKAVVTDLTGVLYLVDLTSNSITSTLQVGGWTEEMERVGNEVFVVQRSGFVTPPVYNRLLVLDGGTVTIVDTIETAPNPGSLVKDQDGSLWVLCGGDSSAGPELTRIDPASRSVLTSIALTDNTAFGGPSELAIDGNGSRLYYLNADLYSLLVTDVTEPSAPLVVAGSSAFYDFAVHPTTGEIYITDGIDFQQSGSLLKYAADGSFVNIRVVGVAPGDFFFR